MIIYININFLKKTPIMLKISNELANSSLIEDRRAAVELFATGTKLKEKKGSCDNCIWISQSKKECTNPNIKNCNVFTNSLFVDINSKRV